jgi:hypothetical protein
MELPVNAAGFSARKLSVVTSVWRGARLFVDGAPAEGKRGAYTVRDDAGQDVAVALKNRVYDPIPLLTVGGASVELARPLAWYEYAWIGVPLLLAVNGGALGGLFGGLAFYASAHVFRSGRGAAAKYALSALLSVAAFVALVICAVILRILIRRA